MRPMGEDKRMSKPVSARKIARANLWLDKRLTEFASEMESVLSGSNAESMESRIEALEAELKSLKASMNSGGQSETDLKSCKGDQ